MLLSRHIRNSDYKFVNRWYINFNLIDDDLTLYSKFKRISITNYINNINEYNESSNTLYDYLYNHKSNIDFLNKQREENKQGKIKILNDKTVEDNKLIKEMATSL